MQNFAEIVKFVEHASSNDKSGGGKLRDRLNNPEKRKQFVRKTLPRHVSQYVLRPAKEPKKPKVRVAKTKAAKPKGDPTARYLNSEGEGGGDGTGGIDADASDIERGEQIAGSMHTKAPEHVEVRTLLADPRTALRFSTEAVRALSAVSLRRVATAAWLRPAASRQPPAGLGSPAAGGRLHLAADGRDVYAVPHAHAVRLL